MMEKIERLRDIARQYYLRKDIQSILVEQAISKEVVPRYFDSFGKRPDVLEYPTDVANLAFKGATSFHCSEELWQNPLEIGTNLRDDELNKIRIGWDLILDIDCKFIEYSKIAAWLLTEALYFHGIKNLGLKFSGGSGFHIGVGFKAFPKEVHNVKIKDFFPQGPRLIANYLRDMMAKDLASRILEISTLREIANAVNKPVEDLLDKEKKFNPFSVVGIDTVLISSRHLCRMAYSLHEKTGLASIVIKPEQLKQFNMGWAKPQRVFAKRFIPEPETDEAKELFVQALDWNSRIEEKKSKKDEETVRKDRMDFREINIIDKNNLDQFYPPSIKIMLQGVKQDGRKRTLFVLINFFRSLNFNNDEIKKIITEWNLKNYKPLKENYVETQLGWFRRQGKMLPPNFDNRHYYDDVGAIPDEFSLKLKNPINYVKYRIKMSENEKTKPKIRRNAGKSKQ